MVEDQEAIPPSHTSAEYVDVSLLLYQDGCQRDVKGERECRRHADQLRTEEYE